ncbi:MAG: 2-polyprenyl-3-methyl-6-methoxy-1,4-benzoquinone monooxygenase [Formosimonas sp.]
MRIFTTLDHCIDFSHNILFTLNNTPQHNRPPPRGMDDTLSIEESKHSAGLMRVNHVGEVCAQALYQGQAIVSTNPNIKTMLQEAAQEEKDHLAWTAQRLRELNSHPSRLNPLWYGGAFALGVLAGQISEAVSLGFVVETERQVGAHLQSHLTGAQALPHNDSTSRAIVQHMHDDELAHAAHAQAAGAIELPNIVKQLMAGMAKVMTSVAYHI